MCGRMTLSVNANEIRRKFPYLELAWEPTPRFNIAPSQNVLVALNDRSGEITTARWGLVPSWEKAPNGGRKPINARLETLAASRMFAPLLHRRRCAVFADGFFEWETEGGKKIPYHFHLRSGEPFAFAGLWDRREDTTCTIITGPPNGLVAPLHDRMPMILMDDDVPAWIEADELTSGKAESMLHPYPGDQMERVQVSSRVNNPQNDDAGVLMSSLQTRVG